MVKANETPSGCGVLDIRPTNTHIPGMNATASFGSTADQQPSLSPDPIDPLLKRNQQALNTYPREIRAALLPLDPGVALEPYVHGNEDEMTISQRLSATPRKRKQKQRYEPQPTQKRRSKKGKEKEHTPIASQKEDDQKEDDEELPPYDDPLAMKVYVEKQKQALEDLRNQAINQSIIQEFEDSRAPSSSLAPQKRSRGRQPNQSVKIGSRLTEKEDLILVSLALKYQALYGVDSMKVFWKRVRTKFEKVTNRAYTSVERRTKDLLEIREEQLKKEAKAGHGHEARDDVWTRVIDDWNEVVKTYEKKKHLNKSAREKKKQDSKNHDRKRESLNARLGNKKKVIIDLSSDVGNETDDDEINTQDDDTDNEESSDDDIPDDLATSPTRQSVQSVDSTRDSPTPGPSNLGHTNPNQDLAELLEGLSSDIETPAPPPRAKKTKKTPQKQQRQRKDRPTAATEKTAELTEIMGSYIKFLMDQPKAAAQAQDTVTTDVEETQFEIVRNIRTLGELGKKQYEQIEDLRQRTEDLTGIQRRNIKYDGQEFMKLDEKLDRMIVHMDRLVENQCSLGRVMNDMNDETKQIDFTEDKDETQAAVPQQQTQQQKAKKSSTKKPLSPVKRVTRSATAS